MEDTKIANIIKCEHDGNSLAYKSSKFCYQVLEINSVGLSINSLGLLKLCCVSYLLGWK